MRKRTQARQIAFQALYQQDLNDRMEPPEARTTVTDLEPFIQDSSDDPEVRQYARTLVDGVIALRPAIDRRISQAAKNWRLERIAPVDRSILRLALFELLSRTDIPPKVAINEAIDLAKKYSTEQSGAFVNGILDQIYSDVRKED